MSNQLDLTYQSKHSAPSHQYEGTKTAIEAMLGVTNGAVAFATDTKKLGTYNGSTWDWAGSSTKTFQRVQSADLTLADGECLVIADYIDLVSYSLTLTGDSTLEIL